ncbi:YkoP family protein [Virgibacillus necropolis]|uniref:YkoP-like domain-containing protein n=1 Tax=Virgibacillus necropolis TaxID=163877 RepID=A0A221MIJ1_9BACI|nr:hypothetical protein [Virgibacillus necropolis]ASN07429.1 hypothetical protein CFK40_16175 [Virgibacillus necropolis]
MSSRIRKYCLFVWAIFDPLYFHFTRLQYIVINGNKTIIRVRVTKYKGKKITLSDGTVINKNDLLLKIHLHNAKILGQTVGYSEIRRALIIYKSVQESLPSIARYLQFHDDANEIKGLIGITMLYKGCKKLGFEACPIHNPYYKLAKQVALSPIYFLSLNKALTKKRPHPMYVFMSKDCLFHKH